MDCCSLRERGWPRQRALARETETERETKDISSAKEEASITVSWTWLCCPFQARQHGGGTGNGREKIRTYGCKEGGAAATCRWLDVL